MSYAWTAGEEVTSSKLNQTGQIPYQQIVGVGQAAVATHPPNCVTSETDNGDVIWVVATSGGNNGRIIRYERDTVTGIYYATHVASIGIPDEAQRVGLAVVGSYLYVAYATSTPDFALHRFDKADLANETAMTISGTAPTASTTGKYFMYSDGTDLYIALNSTTSWARYTISGTTATNVASITSISVANLEGAWSNGSVAYFVDRASNTNTLHRRALTGASQATLARDLGQGRFNDEKLIGFIYFDATVAYVVTSFTVSDELTAVTHGGMILSGLTLP